jgi:hypothetical protein
MSRVLTLMVVLLFARTAAGDGLSDCANQFDDSGTYCEDSRFGIASEDLRDDFARRLRDIAPDSGGRSVPPDLETACSLSSDPELEAAFKRNPGATQALIADIMTAGGFAVCRTDPIAVLRVLGRVKPKS